MEPALSLFSTKDFRNFTDFNRGWDAKILFTFSNERLNRAISPPIRENSQKIQVDCLSKGDLSNRTDVLFNFPQKDDSSTLGVRHETHLTAKTLEISTFEACGGKSRCLNVTSSKTSQAPQYVVGQVRPVLTQQIAVPTPENLLSPTQNYTKLPPYTVRIAAVLLALSVVRFGFYFYERVTKPKVFRSSV